ncbi:MAG: type II methionyl aminopeptidase, partial [Candidatus Micrarchaeaceae archaeon]
MYSMAYDYETAKAVGKASYEALEYGKGLIKPGALLLEIANMIEEHIRSAGFDLAFPVNISINDNAAHYTPAFDDLSAVPEKGLVKLDVGARKGHYLGDCALTVDLSGAYGKLVEASQKALETAISMVKAGRGVNEIGREIEKVAKENGFAAIKNLGGHGIKQHELHAGVFIPNYDNGDSTELEEGQVIAIEPFITDGAGLVTEGSTIEIFQKTGGVQVRSSDSRRVAAFIDDRYLTYPFAARWL